jgi:hypothetical protein
LLENGTTLSGYRIDGILGQGGMGVVYEATQLSLNRTVALKLLAAHLSEDDAFRERFRREGQIQAAIDHTNIVTVYEAGETEHGLFIAMRLIRGPNLKDMIVSRELDAGRSMRILRPVADALETSHGVGLIHRDIKPQNILVGARDHPFLADFGLTKGPSEKSLTRTGQFVGTLDYIAPEQIQGKRATACSDVYALAAVLYECLTGIVPFPRESEAAVLYAHLSDSPPLITDERPELPASLDHVIQKGMAKDPEERYGSCLELFDDAERTFSKRQRATMTPPGPIEAPQDTGIREAEIDVATREARPPSQTHQAPSPVPETTASPAAAASTHGAEPVVEEPRAALEDETHLAAPGRTRASTGARLDAAAPAPPQAPAAAPAAARPLPKPFQITPALTLVAIGVLVAAAIAGFVLGSSGGGSEAQPLPNSTSAGGLQISFPSDWSRTSNNPSIPGLEFREPIELGHTNQSGQRLTAGQVTATGPALLPRSFVSRLPGGRQPPRDNTVQLGELEAYRYANLRPRGFDRDLTLFVSPTSAGVATVACIANKGGAEALEQSCGRMASSLQLTGARAYGVGPNAEYARALDTTISRLNRQVETQKSGLRGAKTAAGQSRSSSALASSYAGAAGRLSKLRVSPADQDANREIAAALRRTASAYTRMSRAAVAGARGEYNSGRVAARVGERRVAAALDRLRALGYSVK